MEHGDEVMGQDICGFVEVKDKYGWGAIVRVGPLVRRNYEIVAILFATDGMFGGRGLPVDASIHTQIEFQDWFNPTFVTLQEIEAMDMNEPIDDAIFAIAKQKDFGPFEADLTESDKEKLAYDISCRYGIPSCDIKFELRKRTVKDLITKDWVFVIQLMKFMQGFNGGITSDCVRLVVGVDQ